ncbi:MAG: HAD family hydrolase [Proteobacteria bacterium]|nr:HAD family hydrolase [Pseudomonadota bacterium]
MNKIKKPKLIIFDLDGTLVEFPIEFMFTKTKHIIEELSHPHVSEEEMMDCFSDFDFFRFVEKDHREAFLKKFIIDFSHDRWTTLEPFPDTLGVLKNLHQQNISLSIATSRVMQVEHLRTALEKVDFHHYIGHIATREGEHISFMDKTKQLEQLFELYQVEPQDCLKIGDIPSDIECAKKAGVGSTVAVLSGKIKEGVLQRAKPDFIISNISELPKIILEE